jgi:hypothetical protein
MEEIISKPFDENVLEERAEDENDLTHANSLGPDSSEISSLYFDDVDDYDDLVINDSTKLTGNYEAKVLVNYFDYNNGNIVSSRSFAKLIQVFVTNENLEDTVKLYHIKGY